MKIRWTEEAVSFLEAQESVAPGVGGRILVEVENRLARFAGIHVVVPILDAENAPRHVFRMFLSRRLPFKVYYVVEANTVVVLAIQHARQRPIELQ